MAAPVKIVLIDDAEIIHESFLREIAPLPWIKLIAYAKSGEEAIQVLSNVRADIAVIDLIMPGIDGLEIARKALQRPGLKVVIFTGMERPELIEKARHMGASAYVVKDRMEHLINVLERLSEGASFLTSLSRSGTSVLPWSITAYTTFPAKLAFSTREKAVLKLWTSGFEVKEISQKLGVCTSTVASHRRAIIRKTGTRSVSELTRISISIGLIHL
jgi:two-component system invasion response regulator UvrY